MMTDPDGIEPLSVKRVEAFVSRAPIENPVKTSFGIMKERPALLIRVEDAEGAYGWGEVWCNFPACGAEHRARLIDTVLAPLLLRQAPLRPREVFPELTAKTHVLGLQTGETGPLGQVIAGLDIAVWDLAARRAGQPLCRILNEESQIEVPAYASGINPGGAARTVDEASAKGYRAFKLKVGFGREQDLTNVKELAAGLKPGESLMLDGNQAWSRSEAEGFVREIGELPIGWLEEPIAVDRPVSEWEELSRKSPIDLAGGENLRSREAFDAVIRAGYLKVLQPDACKWGGITGCFEVAKSALKAGLRYCPHYLGGGIGLLASAHLLAAAGGDGLLEIDCNPNPLREGLASPFPAMRSGRFPIPSGPGLGVEPDPEAVGEFLRLHIERSAGMVE